MDLSGSLCLSDLVAQSISLGATADVVPIGFVTLSSVAHFGSSSSTVLASFAWANAYLEHEYARQRRRSSALLS